MANLRANHRALLLASAACGLVPFVAGAETIGSVAAVNEEMLGTPPAAETRELTLGEGVVSDERVQTGPVGSGQMIFRDQTTLTVWPNSDIALDAYVYDPDRDAGEMTMTMTRGVMRFIGGAISKQQDVTIRTPHGLVGVRGGIAVIEVGDDATTVSHIAGAYTDVNGVRLARSGATAVASGEGPGQTEFVGLADQGALRNVFSGSPGVGTGGLRDAPSPAEVEPLIETSGVANAGSNTPGAAAAPRVSTFNGEEPEAESPAEQENVAQVSVDQQAVVRTAVVEDDLLEPEFPDRFIPDGSPIEGVFGAQYGILGGDAAFGIVVGDTQPSVFDIFLDLETAEVFASAPNGAFFRVDTDAGFRTDVASSFNDLPALANSFVDPGIFYIRTFRYENDDPEPLRALNFFGEPTPTSLWLAPTDGDLSVPVWELSDEAFTTVAGEFGPRLGGLLSDDEDRGVLFLAPQVNADVAIGSTFLGSTAKWGAGFLRIEGAGLDQRTSFSALTTRAELNDVEYPTAITTPIMRTAARFEATDRGVYGDIPYAPIDADGRTAFGPNADYIVLGQAGREITQGDEPDTHRDEPAFLRGEALGEEVDFIYGDTRLAGLDRVEEITAAERLELAAPPSEADFDRPRAGNLTGGYAVTHAASADAETYILSTRGGADVRFGFDPGSNGAVAEFSELQPSLADSTTGLVGLTLLFGNGGSRSAFAADDGFVIREPFNPGGELTEIDFESDNRQLAPPTPQGEEFAQRAFEGVLATAGVVGTGDLAIVDDDPEYLRWGWWSGRVAYDESEDRAQEQLHLGAWVAGVRADAADIASANGVATFDGFAVANVVEQVGSDRAAYVEAGNFGMTYDFDGDVGTATISGILGGTFAGTMTPAGATPGNHFGGALSSGEVAGGRLDGSFFTDAARTDIEAAAGRFEVRGTGAGGGAARAVGIVAADRN